MRDQLEKRRDELAQELKSGQEMLADLDTRRADLQQTMLRISGALQVLEELLQDESQPAPPAVPQPPAPTAAARPVPPIPVDGVNATAGPAPSLVSG